MENQKPLRRLETLSHHIRHETAEYAAPQMEQTSSAVVRELLDRHKSENKTVSVEEFKKLVGKELGTSDWFKVTQQRVNAFADATGDHQWIHIDPERAKAESPFGGPIAHGFLTVSLLPFLCKEAMPTLSGIKMGVNYGINKLRFIAPVPVGSNIRARVVLKECSEIQVPLPGYQAILEVTIERQSESKPACSIEWLTRYYI